MHQYPELSSQLHKRYATEPKVPNNGLRSRNNRMCAQGINVITLTLVSFMKGSE